MVLALSTVITIAAVLRVYLDDIYLVSLPAESTEDTSNPELSDRSAAAMHADGIASVLGSLGLWAIKMNFMSLFYRLGHNIKAYATFWWFAVVVIIACGAVQLGVIPYDCLFQEMAFIKTHCFTEGKQGYIYSAYKVTVAVDILSDLLSKHMIPNKALLDQHS